MATRLSRAAAAAALLATAAFASGCIGGDSDPARLAGRWSGSLSIGYQNGGGASGALDLRLDQIEDFASGVAVWEPDGSTQSVTGPVDSNEFTLLLHFRCGTNPEVTELTGKVDGSTMTIEGGSGLACAGGGAASEVVSATGSLTRTTDNAPL